MNIIDFWNKKSRKIIIPPPIPNVISFIKPTVISPNPVFPPQYFNGTQLLSLYNITPVKPLTVYTRVSKIAIIVAYTYPKLLADLKTYWTNNINYGPNSVPPRVNVYTMPGATQNAGWAQEECLDVQMVCTVNPHANICVVEARSQSITHIIAAIDYATKTLKCDVISMSFGANDVTAIMKYNSNFINNTTNANICFCSASGDDNVVSWPAVLSNCIAVGGTSLLWTPNTGASTQRTEYTWNGAGCGYSSTVTQPAFQRNVSNIAHTFRAIPDVSLIANPNTGVYVVYAGQWYLLGGTSVATPIFSAMLSIANQMRFNANNIALTTVTTNPPVANNIQNCLYGTVLPSPTLYKSIFNDITIGTNDGSNGNTLTTYSAATGWDITTGMGSPNCVNLCALLAKL